MRLEKLQPSKSKTKMISHAETVEDRKREGHNSHRHERLGRS